MTCPFGARCKKQRALFDDTGIADTRASRLQVILDFDVRRVSVIADTRAGRLQGEHAGIL